MSLCQLTQAVQRSGLIQRVKQQIDRHVLFNLDDRHMIVQNRVAGRVNLIKHMVNREDVFDLNRNGCQRRVTDDGISDLQILRIIKLLTDFLDSSERQAAGIGNRVMQFAAADDDIYDFLLDFFFIVITLCTDLLEASALQMYSAYGNPQFIRIDIAAVVQLPRGCRQDILWFCHPFQTVSHFHSRFAPFPNGVILNRFTFYLFSMINHWHRICNYIFCCFYIELRRI